MFKQEYSLKSSLHLDYLIAFALGLFTFTALVSQLDAPGVTWDEGLVNFAAAKNQAEWFRNLFILEAPFSKETIDQYWFTTSDHPSLPRTMAALSHICFTGLVDEIVALRIPSAFLFSILITTIYLFLRAFINILSALFGALSLIFMPRVWGHAHIFSLDLPILCWWFWSTITAYWVLAGRWNPVWFGLVYAITFSTKLHAVFLPFPILIWSTVVLIQHKKERLALLKRIGWAVGWSILLTPIIYFGSQPWLWHDTVTRIIDRFTDYAEKSPIPLYYLGQVYAGNTPWHYPFVMVAVTIPSIIFIFFLLGLIPSLISSFDWTKNSSATSPYAIHLLISLMFITPLLILLLNSAYDGCRLFLPCFPMAALLAGFGFSVVTNFIHTYFKNAWIAWGIMFAALAMPAYSLFHYHPFYLAYYNEFVGGIRGAKEKGFETVYWCDALTKDFIDKINAVLPEDKTVHPKSMEHKVIDYYIERGWLKPRFKDYPWSYALLQSRQGMFPREEWLLYLQRTHKPVLVQELDGVQLYALYQLEE